MMARGTIGLPRKARDADTATFGPNDRPVFDTVHLAPGTEFDTKDYPALTDTDIASLEEQHRAGLGGAERVSQAGKKQGGGSAPVAENTAPRGPFSGQTKAPDPDEVGRGSLGEEGEDGDGEDGADLEAMTRAELEAEAERRGIDVSGARTKADVIAALRA